MTVIEIEMSHVALVIYFSITLIHPLSSAQTMFNFYKADYENINK